VDDARSMLKLDDDSPTLAALDACTTVPVIGGATQAPHLLCEPLPGVAPRGQLVLFFGPISLHHVPPPTQPFVQHARSLGFHYFGVSYPDSPAIFQFGAEHQQSDPDCDYKIRMIRLLGGRYNESAPCTAVEGCVEPATLGGLAQFQAVVQQMAAKPGGWERFADKAQPGGVAWSKIVTAGHSQGSGMALLVGQMHEVAQVVQLSGVDDIDSNGAVPASTAAPWVRTNRSGATPIDRVWGLGNVWGFCCAGWRANWAAIGMLVSLRVMVVCKHSHENV
jgi:hypothetical protein